MKKIVARCSSVRMKLAGAVLLLTTPAILVMYIFGLSMTEFVVGFLALVAAWTGGELFVRRQVKAMSDTAAKIADGDLNARTGLPDSADELGQLAKVLDRMAESLQQRIKEREKLAAFAQLNPYAAMEFAADGKLVYFNDAALEMAHSVEKSSPEEILPEGADRIISECLESGRSRQHLETQMNGRTFSWSFHSMAASRVVHCYAEDITERLSLEAQLRQSQKMESIGQLAAGVAHDFNNILTIIQGHSSVLLTKGGLPSDVMDSVQQVYFASERAASLTRQLLMFGRKNVMQPREINLGAVVGDMNKMLARLLGETISLHFEAPHKLPLMTGDSGMIEQVVMNLAVNARDAMPEGGRLTIDVEAVPVDAAYAETHPDARAGDFVCLRISDTGTGMDSETLNRIFEPFFTTKEVGKGTGLGLATVYGIVKQHDGWIEVTSERGRGTMFEVFFPISETEAPLKREAENANGPIVGGDETILIVEDEPILREMARDILRDYGYEILEAATGREAIEIWRQAADKIDLLLTDMVMPEGVSGVDLAERLLADRPALKIIFTSGYASNEINGELLTRSQARFLQKPYGHDSLARIVRNCLDKTGAIML